jgi:molecular chaperone GrpE
MSQGTESSEPRVDTTPETPAGSEPPAEAAPSSPVIEPAVAAELQQAKEEAAKARAELEAAQVRLRAVSKAYSDLQQEMAAFKQRMETRARMDGELQAFDQVRAFFDPVMNLKRSIGHAGSDVAVLVDGLRMVHHQFMESLHKLGLEEVPGVGATFDPRLHEALGVAPVTDAAQDGKVLIVHTVGYTVKGRVLQAAQVVIGKHQESAGEA